jgi:arylsulfatase A-like enzyme
MPTILDLFDLPQPYPLAGASLLPMLDAAAPPQQRRALQQRSLVASNFAYARQQCVEFAVVRAGRWKLMHSYSRKPAVSGRLDQPFLLFDIQLDYHEQDDVIDDHQDVARRLIGHLLTWRRQHPPLAKGSATDHLLLDRQQLEELRSLGYVE